MATTARQMILSNNMAEGEKIPAPNFKEIGSRGEDLDVTTDGRLNNDDEISMDTYRKMRKDPQVKACLLVLKLPILQVDFSFHADTEEGEKLGQWAEKRIYDMDDSMQYYLREMLTALDFGHSVTEKIWQLKSVPVDAEGESSRMDMRVVPLKLKTYDPRSLEFKVNPVTFKLEGVMQKQKKGPDIEIPADKLMIYSHEKEFGDYNGESALKAAYKPWIIKEFLQKFWNIALERYGTPFQSMSMPQGGNINTAIGLMDQIKGKTGIPLPEGYELEIHNLSNAGMSFKEAIEYQDTQIARSMLVPDLVFGSAAGGGGAYALSKTHATMFLLRLNGITQEIGDIISNYLVKPLIRYNYGEVTEFPSFKFSDVGEDDLKTLLDIVDKLITGKVVAPTEKWIRERFGLPAPDEEAQEYLEKQHTTATTAMDNLTGDPDPDDPDDKKNKKPGDPDPEVSDPDEDKKKQNNLSELPLEDYLGDLRKSLRGIQLGLTRNQGE